MDGFPTVVKPMIKIQNKTGLWMIFGATLLATSINACGGEMDETQTGESSSSICDETDSHSQNCYPPMETVGECEKLCETTRGRKRIITSRWEEEFEE